jgi:hypothetical protein
LRERIVEISPVGIRDFPGASKKSVHACGDDHLDADTVVLNAKREGKKERKREMVGQAIRLPP